MGRRSEDRLLVDAFPWVVLHNADGETAHSRLLLKISSMGQEFDVDAESEDLASGDRPAVAFEEPPRRRRWDGAGGEEEDGELAEDDPSGRRWTNW
jgi:hypothetical protein